MKLVSILLTVMTVIAAWMLPAAVIAVSCGFSYTDVTTFPAYVIFDGMVTAIVACFSGSIYEGYVSILQP